MLVRRLTPGGGSSNGSRVSSVRLTAALRVQNHLLTEQHTRCILPLTLASTGADLSDGEPVRGKYNMTCQPHVPRLVVGGAGIR